MKISRLKLTNVRCYNHLDIDFETYLSNERKLRNRTIILGNNGSGKTTVLKSIALLLSGSSALGELIGDTNTWIKHDKENCLIEGIFETENHEKREIKIAIERNDTLSQLLIKNQDYLKLLDEAIEHAQRNYLNIGYGIHRKIGGSGFKNKSSIYHSQRAENVATLFNSLSSLFPFESWIMDIDYIEGEKGLKRIKDCINKLIPNNKLYKIDKKNKTVLFKNKDGIIPFSQLSGGLQITANWLGDLLYRISHQYGDYKNPFEANFILLVDEIGLHLHPSWQRSVIQNISDLFINAQIIATTHSPFIAQQAGPEELYTIIRNKQNNLDLFHYKNDPRKLLIHQIIMSDLFGITTDESVMVENVKNNIRKDPSLQNEALIQTSQVSLQNIDSVIEIPMHQYSYEADINEVVKTLKAEAKKIENEKTK